VPHAARAGVRDTPFLQDSSEKFALAPELANAALRKLVLDREGNVLVLTDRGVARLSESTRQITLDHGYRPLEGVVPRDVVTFEGSLHYLLPQWFLSNDNAGENQTELPPNDFKTAAIASETSALFLGSTNAYIIDPAGPYTIRLPPKFVAKKIYADQNVFYLLATNGIYRLRDHRLALFHPVHDANALGFLSKEIVVGTQEGYYKISKSSGRPSTPLDSRLPFIGINAVAVSVNGIWLGGRQGVFLEENDGARSYYSSLRWLREDQVLDLLPDKRGNLYVLGPTGVSLIRFTRTTLAQKAVLYEENIRRRHIRYGFCSELRLSRPGDPASSQMIDTDNDGTWSSYYMASQAFHYAATGDEQARAHAWETFATMERLLTITGIPGLPARSFERSGFEVSDREKWRPSHETGWDWKSDTSSDEITAHWFGASVMLECVAKTPPEHQRVARFIETITGYILRNHFQLIDWTGKPTLWGRWNPEYVNNYPFSVFDRRLNSTEIVAGLELAGRATGNSDYFKVITDLFYDVGPAYLANITAPMSQINSSQVTNYSGNQMGDSWNHSDDLLAFIAYWVLTRNSTPDVHGAYVAAVRDHFQFERNERNPLFNFIYASTGAGDAELESAVWTLRRYPLDLITWRIENSRRLDITRLPANFRQQELAELLPPGERPVTRWNTHPFVLDGGDGGATELAGDEFLLPYWMGRYLKLIE
jgi:hypothetical protein